MQLKGFKKPYWRFENGRRLRGEGGGGIGGLIARKGTINKSLYKKQCLAVYYSTQLCSCIQVSSIRGGDRVPSCRHRAGGVCQILAGMQFSTWVLKCVVIC